MTRIRSFLCLLLAAVLALSCAVPALADVLYRKGDTGDEITRMQARLQELGYLERDPDGIFDDDTEAALYLFQNFHGLLATGIADTRTLDLLYSDGAKSLEEVWYWDDYEVEACYESDAYWNAPAMAAMPAPMGTAAPKGWGSAPDREGWNTNEYAYITENGFQSVSSAPLSTFAADVDTASYTQVRSLVLSGRQVPADAVRIEEMLNYFSYDYDQPEGDSPLGVTMTLGPCPWNEQTLLLQVGLQAAVVMPEDRPRHNLVFLIDVSGSMFGADRLDLVKRAFLLLVETLEPTDTVSIVVYASQDRVVIEGVPASEKTTIMAATNGLEAGGSTNSASGIRTAYQIAERYASEGSVNRIIMATDGDFNVGTTSEGDLARLVLEKKQGGVKLTMLGVGYGNYKDAKLETLADYGDGNYYYLDNIYEARRALVTEAGGTFVEVARDVKLQVDFNPAMVRGYRLIGYEDRVMAAQDFDDDTKDGGELGSGHRLTVLYEIVPVASSFELPAVESRYAQPGGNDSGEWLTLSIRAKLPGEEESRLWSYPLTGEPLAELPENMRWAAAVAEAGMILRNSEYKGTATWASALALARSCPGVTGDAFKEEFVYLLTLMERAQ